MPFSRALKENTQGWSLMLLEDGERYELMGYDYVLDLISEIEIAPGFPTCKAYFLVSTDRSQERLSNKRHHEGYDCPDLFVTLYFPVFCLSFFNVFMPSSVPSSLC